MERYFCPIWNSRLAVIFIILKILITCFLSCIFSINKSPYTYLVSGLRFFLCFWFGPLDYSVSQWNSSYISVFMYFVLSFDKLLQSSDLLFSLYMWSFLPLFLQKMFLSPFSRAFRPPIGYRLGYTFSLFFFNFDFLYV